MLCREEALAISKLFAERKDELGETKLIGVVKEVAPTKDAATDEILGLGEFQEKYFQHPIYLDANWTFYEALGNKNLLFQSWSSWNPFTVYSDLNALGARLKSKGIEGNYKGEGFTKGGVMLLTPRYNDIYYMYHEKSGSELPTDEIANAIKEMNSLQNVESKQEF